MKCICSDICIQYGLPPYAGRVYVHIMSCPKSSEYAAYCKLPWYKKLFTKNPLNY